MPSRGGEKRSADVDIPDELEPLQKANARSAAISRRTEIKNSVNGFCNMCVCVHGRFSPSSSVALQISPNHSYPIGYVPCSITIHTREYARGGAYVRASV